MRRMLTGLKLVFYTSVFYFLTVAILHAQEIKVSGRFLKDSVQIGESVGYTLTAAYPQKLTVLFPDSTFDFKPFEYSRKDISVTKTVNGISYDSVVYYLNTFEIDKVQLLGLPVFVTSARDCTEFVAPADSIFLVELVKTLPPDSIAAQNLPLKTNTLYEKVFTQFNYILLTIGVGILIIGGILVWAFFGNRIIRYLKIRKLEKKYQKFVTEFTAQLNQLNSTFTPELAEQSVLTWKKYMEGLSEFPYTKYTTPEIKKVITSNTIGSTLSSIDRMIYGSAKPDTLDAFLQLKSEAEHSFKEKIAKPDEQTSPQYTVTEIEDYAGMLVQLPCPICDRTTQPLNGTIAYTVKSFIAYTQMRKKVFIACPDCLTKKNNQAIVISALLGWWGFPWGLIKTPQYIYYNVKAKKENKGKHPNNTLLAFAFRNAQEIEVNKNNPEKLKDIIKPKKNSWLP